MYFDIVKYWFKVLSAPDNIYIKIIYNLMLRDIEQLPNKVSWASLLRDILMSLGFYNAWPNQGVGNYNGFMPVLKQRFIDNFIQNLSARLDAFSRALFYRFVASFKFQPYLEYINIYKYSRSLSKLRMSSH